MIYKNWVTLNVKLLRVMYACVLLMVVGLSSCKYINQKNEILDAFEKNGVEVPAELREETGFNWADVIFPVSIVLSLGFIGFFIFIKAKRRINDIGYSVSEMKNKLETTVKDKQLYDKMSKEEKEQFDAIQRLFNKKSGK